jgi:hypothetical protein
VRFLPTEIFCLSYSGRSMPPYGRGLLHTIGELQGLKPLVMSCGNVAPKGATHKEYDPQRLLRVLDGAKGRRLRAALLFV